MRRLNAFRVAGSGKAITPCLESLQKAKILLSGPPTDADVDLPTGASWSLQPLVCLCCAPLSADIRTQYDGCLQAQSIHSQSQGGMLCTQLQLMQSRAYAQPSALPCFMLAMLKVATVQLEG